MRVKKKVIRAGKAKKLVGGKKRGKVKQIEGKNKNLTNSSLRASAARRKQASRPLPKPRKNYKLPNYKKKCIECAQFKFIKGGWSLCMQCYEKRYGKYMGEDRFLYVQQPKKLF